MGSNTSRQATQKMVDLYSNSCLTLPPKTVLWNIKEAGDEPLIDILLYEVGKGNPFADPGMFHYERTYWCHKGVGPDNRWYVCPRETRKLPCPICEYRQQLKEDPQADKKLIDALSPSRRQLFNVIDCNHREKGVQVWDFSYHLFGKLLTTYLTKERLAEKLKYWNEFEGGMSLALGLEKKSYEGNKFVEVKLIDFEERRKDYDPEEMLKKVLCLDDLIRVLPYNELKKVFMQTGEETAETKHKSKEINVKAIRDMTDRELNKFIVMNDLDIEPGDFKETEELAEAVIDKWNEINGDGSSDETGKEESKPSGKKDQGKDKGKAKPKEEALSGEIEEGSKVTYTNDDGDEVTVTVTEIKGKKATVEDENGNEDIVLVKDLTLAEDEGGDKEASGEIEEGSDVKWTDDDLDSHEGTVEKLKGEVALVKEGKKSYKVKVADLELA